MQATIQAPFTLERPPMESNKPFPETLANIMAMQDVGHRELARRCKARDWGSHATINSLVAGTLRPSVKAMEAIAVALQIRPETFAEYRLAIARRKLDPEVVGLKQALKNLELCVGL